MCRWPILYFGVPLHNRHLNDDHGQDEPVDPHAHSDDGDDAEDGNDIDTIRLVYILQIKGAL